MNLLGHKNLLGNRAIKLPPWDSKLYFSATYMTSLKIGYSTAERSYAQSFTIPYAGSYGIQWFSIRASKQGTHPTYSYIYAHIYSDDNGLPGTSLKYVKVQQNYVGTIYTNTESFNFGGFALNGLTKYWIVMTSSYTSTSYYYRIGYGGPNLHSPSNLALYSPWSIYSTYYAMYASFTFYI